MLDHTKKTYKFSSIMQTTTRPSNGQLAPRIAVNLDTLAERTFDELDAMYRAASAPESLHAADGVLVGRMLAMRGADRGPLARWLRRLAISPGFAWRGKTLAAHDADRGEGVNRISLGNVLGRQNLFPFASRFGRSLFDGKQTIIIDYDRPANPPYMRRIHDEVRELEPRLFLGIDMWKTARGSVGLVWFALDGRAN